MQLLDFFFNEEGIGIVIRRFCTVAGYPYELVVFVIAVIGTVVLVGGLLDSIAYRRIFRKAGKKWRGRFYPHPQNMHIDGNCMGRESRSQHFGFLCVYNRWMGSILHRTHDVWLGRKQIFRVEFYTCRFFPSKFVYGNEKKTCAILRL